MKEQKITIYEPYSRFKIGFFQTWMVMVKNIIDSKELIYQLFRRDFLMQYKRSFLGFGWFFISPIIGIASWVFLNATGVLQPGEVGIPYPAYVLLSSSIWGLFMGFYQSSSGTLAAGAGFINQVKFPHEALLVKQTAQHLTNFLITFLVNIIVLIAFGVTPSWYILLFPIVIIPLFLLGAALGLIISVVSVVATDVTNIVNILLGFVFYITPVIYSIDDKSDTLKTVIKYNPLTYLISGVRDLMIYGRIEDLNIFLAVSLGTFILFLLSWRLFYVSEDRVIERMI